MSDRSRPLDYGRPIVPFDSEYSLWVTPELLLGVIMSSQRLTSYCRLSDFDKTNESIAPPYVLEFFVMIVRRTHRDPVRRNIRMSPQRADQVLVYVPDADRWKVQSMTDAMRTLFDGVKSGVRRVLRSEDECRLLSPEIQGAVSCAVNMYEDDVARYLTNARQQLTSHFADLALQWARAH